MRNFKLYKFNVLKSPVDKRDWKAKSIYYKLALPDIVDYRKELFAIRDQGLQGSCAAMAGSTMKEWQELKDCKINDYMSAQFIYNNRKDRNSEGMYMRDLMYILKTKGDCMERDFPYGSQGLPSEKVYIKAKKYLIKNYAAIDTVEELKTALYINGPCVIAVPVYNYTTRMWKQRAGDELMGGHAMACVGYNENGFIIRNSWSEQWGDNGYCIFPYKDWGLQWEVWTSIDAKSFEEPVKKPKNWFMRLLPYIIGGLFVFGVALYILLK